jgi:hypothetical protein
MTIVGYVLAVPLVFGLLAYHGWALATLWGWFIVPLGAPPIGWAQFVGISLFLAVFRNNRRVLSKRKWGTGETLGWVLFPGFAVLLGLFVRWCV